MSNPFLMYDNVVPLLSPQDITNAETTTGYMDLRNAQKAGILVLLGNIDSGTATDTEVISLYAATAEGGTEAQVAFRYRKSGIAPTANTWGAITTADTTGVTYALTDDNVWLWIEIDPDELAASDYRYVRVLLSSPADMANFVTAVVGFIQARYKQTTMKSATASASS